MPQNQRQQQVLDLLKDLRGIDPLKKLFWEELSYERVNQPLSRRGWTDSVGKALADDPVLFAGGGDGNAFHVIYCRLASDKLLLGGERPVVSRLLNEHPYVDRFGGCGLGHGAMERPMPACVLARVAGLATLGRNVFRRLPEVRQRPFQPRRTFRHRQ